MNTWIDKLMDDYYRFLRERTAVITETGTEWVVISTPFYSAFNDNLEIYAKKKSDKIILSDDGVTLKNIDLQGVSVKRSARRRELFENILLTYGISDKNDELIVETTETSFAQKKHNLVTAILEINDMYMLSKQSVSSIFKEDVKYFLDEQNIVHTPQFISKGKTGLEFTFDFQIAYKNKEIIIKSFNTLNKQNVPNFLFTWGDVKEAREQITKKNIVGVAVINDTERDIEQEYIDAFASRNTKYILWSEKEKTKNINILKNVA